MSGLTDAPLGSTASRGPAEDHLGPFGLDASTEALYRIVLRFAGDTIDTLSDRTGLPEPALHQQLQPLLDLRLVQVDDGRVSAEPPDLALGRLVSERARALRIEEDRLTAVRAAIPDFVSAHERGHAETWQPVPIELIESGDLVDTMEMLLRNSTGELLFFRPDQFWLPSGQQMDEIVLEALHEGRRCRTMYPSGIGDELPEAVRTRAAAGDRVRVVPDLPARLAIFGRAGLVVPEDWESPVGRRLLIRHPAVVSGMITLFDAYWDRGVALPGLGDTDVTGSDDLIALLARGAKDEQAARLLGVSLRTVRRRVAALMAELGAESRFQAGMELVRRGLL